MQVNKPHGLGDQAHGLFPWFEIKVFNDIDQRSMQREVILPQPVVKKLRGKRSRGKSVSFKFNCCRKEEREQATARNHAPSHKDNNAPKHIEKDSPAAMKPAPLKPPVPRL